MMSNTFKVLGDLEGNISKASLQEIKKTFFILMKVFEKM